MGRNDGYVTCSVCNSMYTYSGDEPTQVKVNEQCNGHGRDDFSLSERINYALYWSRVRAREDQED